MIEKKLLWTSNKQIREFAAEKLIEEFKNKTQNLQIKK